MDLDISDPEKIKQLIQVLQSLLPQNNSGDSEEDEQIESKIKTKTVRSGKKNKSKNKFLTMPEKDMHKSDTAIDKLLNKAPPTPRNRPYEAIEVVCRVCHKKEMVSPAVVPESIDRYKCNKCSGSAGG